MATGSWGLPYSPSKEVGRHERHQHQEQEVEVDQGPVVVRNGAEDGVVNHPEGAYAHEAEEVAEVLWPQREQLLGEFAGHQVLRYVGHAYIEDEQRYGYGEHAVAKVDDAVPVPTAFGQL